jgi:hypothetical protein
MLAIGIIAVSLAALSVLLFALYCCAVLGAKQ